MKRRNETKHNSVDFGFFSFSKSNWWWWWWIVFVVWLTNERRLRLISRRDHCQRFSPSQISDTPQAGSEPAQNLNSDFVGRRCDFQLMKCDFQDSDVRRFGAILKKTFIMVIIIKHPNLFLFDIEKKHFGSVLSFF